MRGELTVGNDERGAAFLGEAVGAGKQNHQDVKRIEAARRWVLPAYSLDLLSKPFSKVARAKQALASLH